MARPFVGRAAELSELHGALEEAARGRGRACLIAGEPGIGKTRLCDRISSEAAGLGMHVLWGRCWEAGGAPAYWPWLDVLHSLLATLNDADLKAALGDGAAALMELLPSVRQRLPDLAPGGTELRSSDEARFRLYRAVLGLLRSGARAPGALIVIDDLHAADEASLQLLRFVAREARSLKVLLLATYRDVDGRWTPSGERALAQLAREAATLQLKRLSQNEAEQLIEARAGEVEPAVRAKLAARGAGHPLFLEELVRSAARDPSGDVLPGNVRELIRERLVQISASVRAVLDLAAIAGDSIEPGLLAEALSESYANILPALDTACEAGIVRRQSSDSFRFMHELIREALIRELPSAARAELHAQVARALAARPEAKRSDAELAHHWLSAGEIAVAARHADRAAEHASALFAYEEAVQLLERLLAAIEEREATARAGGLAELRATTQIALARAHIRRGDYPAGRALCERAAATARQLGDADLLARAALALGLDITAALIDQDLIAMLQSALAALPAGDSPLRVNVTARLAAALQPHPNLLYPIGLAREAIASARRLGQPETLLNALYTGMAAMMDIVDPKERMPMNLEVERLATEAGDRDRLLRTQARLAFDHMELGELAAADARIDAFERMATESGARRYTWRAPLLRSMRAMMHGRFEEAEMHIERARVLGRAASDPQADRCFVMHYEGLLRAAERHDAMIAFDPEARRARAAFYSGPHWQNGGSAFTFSRLEDVAGTARYLAQVPQDDWPIVHNPPGFAHLGEPLAMCGELHAVEHVYGLLSPAAEIFVSWGYTGVVWDGPATRILGLLAVRLERWDQAEAHFASALAALERLDTGPYLARTSYEHGRALQVREPERARLAIERAHALAEQLGMPGLVRLCDARLKALRGSAPKAHPVSARPPAPAAVSIASEGEVWMIAFAGEVVRLRDRLGMQYLSRLIAAPGQPIHALELAQTKVAPDAELTSVLHGSDAGEELDTTARAQYRARVQALREELDEAEAVHDAERAEHLRGELTFVAAELSRAVGLSGRARRAGSAAERARTAVQRRIKSALERIEEVSPELASFLENTVKTGTYCEYRPELAARS
jgi:tetratricopeptide (TPR) repeat protein